MSILRRRIGAQNSAGELYRAPSANYINLTFSSLDEIQKRAQAALEKTQTTQFVYPRAVQINFDEALREQRQAAVEKTQTVKSIQFADTRGEAVSLVEEFQTTIVYYQVSAGHVV